LGAHSPKIENKVINTYEWQTGSNWKRGRPASNGDGPA